MRWRYVCAASAVAAIVWPLTGCGGSAKPDEARGNLLLSDANNYRTMADLTIPIVDTTAATDADICWGAVTNDLQCHPVSATADLDNVSLLRISHLSKDQVRARVAAGTLSQSDVAGYVDFKTDHSTTCTKLSKLSFFGTVIDVPSQYIESADYTYLMLFSKGTTPGQGARTMIFLNPTAGSPNHQIDAPTGCGMLDFTADLSSLTKLAVSAAGPWVLDWRDITRDGQNNDVPFEKIDGVTIGFYAGLTVPDLEARIFDIELIATNLWDIPLESGRTADLATATERTTHETFAGFSRTDAGTWMLALTCSRCQNPAPVLLTILEPSAGAT
ncbi:MAG TPA: hypothetical protein VN903_16755 [Polyangia bacterium]|jgi:hypothetical protein|nr:hypothetical protein [Polyangia bacterium]